MAAAQMQRQWDLEDRDEARAYDRAELDESRAYSRQALSQLVVDAEAAGFNPLTIARAGGASNYNAAAGFAPLSATTVRRQAPVRQAVGGSAVGDALQDVGDFISNFDPFADTKREQEYRLVESQIAALNASALSGVPRGAGSFASGDVERRSSGKAAALGKPAKWEPGDVSVTNPFSTVDVDGSWSDASVWGQRYGEPGEWVGGVLVGAADAKHIGEGYARWMWDNPPPADGVMRSTARWLDKAFGTERSKKGARLSRSVSGGGGW